MNIKKSIRIMISANFLLLFVFAFLPVFMLKPDIDLMQSLLEYINKE